MSAESHLFKVKQKKKFDVDVYKDKYDISNVTAGQLY